MSLPHLSEQQCAVYDRDGYVVVRNVLDQAGVARLLERADGMIAGDYPSEGFICGSASDEATGDPGRLIKQIMPVELPVRDDVLAEWYDHAVLKSCAAELLRCASVEPFQQQILIKEPGEANGTPWHQDDFYWRLPANALTAWVPLLPTSAKNGTMWMLPGSHREKILPHVRAGGISKFHTIEQSVDESRLVPLELQVGDVSFHHQRLIHGAKANYGRRRRVALAMHFRAVQAIHRERVL